MNYMAKHPVLSMSIEYNDNRLSLFAAQKGKCAITKQPLDETLETHHIIPKCLGGTDEYKNLSLITYEIHKLIHATNDNTIQIYLDKLNLQPKELDKLNKYRIKCGNEIIKSE